MLALSNLSVIVNKSNDYRKCLIVLYGFAMSLLLSSTLPQYGSYLTIMVLLIYLIPIIHTGKPHQNIQRVVFQGNKWQLFDSSEISIEYDCLIPLFTGHFFILLSCRGDQMNRVIVVFKDQMTQNQWHSFMVLLRQSTQEQ